MIALFFMHHLRFCPYPCRFLIIKFKKQQNKKNDEMQRIVYNTSKDTPEIVLFWKMLWPLTGMTGSFAAI